MAPQSTQEIDTDSLEAKLQRISLASLGEGPHRDILNRAIRNVLSTDISEITLAQIVDGLPLSEVERDTYTGYGYLSGDHPLSQKHKQLCPGLLHEYRISARGSRTFQTRLIELVAVAIYQIVPPKDHLIFWIYNSDGAPPTLFQHRQYCYYDQYPDGIADGIGYWAESRIFGGVVLFDRREPDSADDVDPEGVYLHPERNMMTYRIYRLLDSQKLELLQFLLSEAPSPGTSPLPILEDQNNRRRVDLKEPVETTGIYRDLWERKPLGKDQMDRRLKDVIDRIDFPTDEDLEQAQERAAIRRERTRGEGLGLKSLKNKTFSFIAYYDVAAGYWA
ncbi:hypothetical protein F5X99DRAFT_431797 [Biscogniauxia marginata]|nr:hypothetical protein F5X99DRAFT_431797 [Biscogniauxia marginata]